ncbi:hypothetical protein FP74_gp089 [Bacillus phage CAM003]|uniref:Uncharacterized protein n=2 Tax=Bastillevirus TaxID=1918010 RepID=A0A024B2E9_9CAUD|nr:hypothetical protein FP73_gp086 [Bacillus phage Hoody T]YP_009037173.1 hypothetical protein FP74_gp089 [Bacillus phage CAM003]AHZ09707.1 hypothetical protein [Bacillus phage CAM003]AHZ10567.1 hypothetical protein [Bacillus phage Hoody T]
MKFKEYDMLVVGEDKKVYGLEIGRRIDSKDDIAFVVELNLIAGWDYVSPDYNDIQGYVPANRFVEYVQYEHFVWYADSESLKEALHENNYEQASNSVFDRIMKLTNEWEELEDEEEGL